MKNFCFVFILLLLHHVDQAQTVLVSGQCINSPVTLSPVANVDGKPAYSGDGTVLSVPGVSISIYWIGAPDNVWVLAFDGQPYFQNACPAPAPPGTQGSACAWTTVPGQDCTGSSPLTITGTGIVPVTLTSFNAIETSNRIRLTWQTSTEINNRKFDIQRSGDGSNWILLGSVDGAGNSDVVISYQFTDSTPLAGRNFYRLVQMDFDGKTTYSRIISLDRSAAPSFFTIAGNPGNGIYSVNIKTARPVTIWVTDLSGKRLLTKIASPGQQRIDISGYPAGMYLLQVKTTTNVSTEKLIKQ